MRVTGWSPAAAGMLIMVLAAAGCASDADTSAVSASARAFGEVIQNGDTAKACAMLTPRTRADLVASEGQSCMDSFPDASQLRIGAVQGASVWSDRAQVDTEGGIVFLARFGSGWLVSAAGCTPRDEAPYLCVVGS